MEYPKLEGAALDAAIAYYAQITNGAFHGTRESDSPLSDKGRNVVRLLNSGVFNCHTSQTATLLSILLDEPISKFVKACGTAQDQFLLQNTIVTCIAPVSACRPGISYAVACCNRDGSVRVVNAANESFSGFHKNHYREATHEEIVAFVTERHGGAAQVPTQEFRSPQASDEEVPW